MTELLNHTIESTYEATLVIDNTENVIRHKVGLLNLAEALVDAFWPKVLWAVRKRFFGTVE